MTRMEKICRVAVVLFVLLVVQVALSSDFQVRHAAGGQAHALEVDDSYWYQAVGDKLVVIRRQGNGQVATRMLTTYPAAASCSDLLLASNNLYALLDGKGVVTFSLRDAVVPVAEERFTSEKLGILPRDLVMVGDWPVAIGDGGAVRLTDGSQLLQTDGRVTGIAMSMNRGLVYAQDGLLFDGDTGEHLGVATTLLPLDDNANADIGTLVYTVNGESITEVGLLGGGVRSIDSAVGKVELRGAFRNMLSRGSRLIVTTDEAIYIIGIAPDELRLMKTIEVENAYDVDIIAANYLAICGEFGRGVYRIQDDRGGSGGQLLRSEASLGVLGAGQFDFRGVHVPSGSGSIYYGFDQSVRTSDVEVGEVQTPKKAIVLGLEAAIDDASGNVVITDAKGFREFLDLPTAATTIVPIGGDFWIGTQDAIHIISRSEDGAWQELGAVEIAGPIVQLIPLFDGSVAFVSHAGMVGIVEQAQAVVALQQ